MKLSMKSHAATTYGEFDGTVTLVAESGTSVPFFLSQICTVFPEPPPPLL
jgi:hypothetical protein